MSALISVVLGVVSALGFSFITSRKVNQFTRVCIDVIFSFFTIFALYVSAFLLTNGNVMAYVYTLFAFSFIVTLTFIYPKKKKVKTNTNQNDKIRAKKG